MRNLGLALLNDRLKRMSCRSFTRFEMEKKRLQDGQDCPRVQQCAEWVGRGVGGGGWGNRSICLYLCMTIRQSCGCFVTTPIQMTKRPYKLLELRNEGKEISVRTIMNQKKYQHASFLHPLQLKEARTTNLPGLTVFVALICNTTVLKMLMKT